MPGPSSSNQAQEGHSADDQPLYPPLPSVESDESDNEETSSRKMTPTEKLKIIEAILSAPDDAKKIEESIEKALPSDVTLNFRQIQATIHSDRFPDPVEKDKATKAFQKLGFLRDNVGAKSSKVDKNNAFNFGNDPDRPQPHVEGEVSPYHEESHHKATPHMQVLLQALVDNPLLQPRQAPTSAVRDAVSALDKINSVLKEENAKHGQDSDLGIIRYSDLLAKWRPILLLEDDDTKKMLHGSLLAYCKQMHYPLTWANQPPSSDPSSGQKGKVPESQSTSNDVADTAQDKDANSQVRKPALDSTYSGANAAAAIVPRGSTPQQTFNMQVSSGTTIPQAGSPYNDIALQAGSGQKRVVALRPRKVQRAIQPGFTTSGEKILFIQPLGLNARFVVTDSEGKIRLVPGSQPTIDLANSAGVRHTLQDPVEIQKLRARVRCGGEYGLEFVAIGEWDITSNRLPFIVVGFYHQNESGRCEEGISRSALAKILGTREGEKLVVESIVGNTDMSLKEALKSQISPGTQENSSNNAPRLLPYREQTQPWWCQPTPQHYVSNVDFNADPTQRPYPSHFQQVVPEQFQQFAPRQHLQQVIPQQHQKPFPYQYQAGPFAMPPQPILDPSMMKSGNSPAASLMEVDEV
ncbi:uncharacterized protein N7446_010561 [Penicillium canescens]|uniref:Uncharacterized protein n=1 Tax=Penicillium canescens TaxID=5083 RepID=A0AAD6ICJ0_PENCN|nr:uncharacterized protein N7446_010561 [Penicillium canescens]KAJ6041557.1 hypothetical protein N7460_006947 [Penicillium canescens]KAJ6050452.1 hypothetical protein N7446_010561 [Penicillium canescens]KAJ6064755.1 hypothetical protein N7444_000408 [Penicillium canescens]